LPRPSGLSAFAEREVAVFAPSSAVTEILRADGFAAETFQMLMHNEALQAETAAKILWIDEAGFLNSRQMLWLAECAAEHNNRVILTGDPHQHHALERGDMLRILVKANAVRVAELTQIQRQTDPDLRAAVHALSTGEVGRGFEMLDEAGRITEIEDDSERDFVLVQKHLKALAQGQSPLVVSSTHAEARNVADKIREALRESGAIGAEVFGPQRLRPWEKSNRAAMRSDARRHNNAGAKKNNESGTRRHVSVRKRATPNATRTKLSWRGSFGRAALGLERIARMLWREPANFCQALPSWNDVNCNNALSDDKKRVAPLARHPVGERKWILPELKRCSPSRARALCHCSR
jgi:hypothetical protein